MICSVFKLKEINLLYIEKYELFNIAQEILIL